MRLAAWLATAALIAGCANAAVGVGTGSTASGGAASVSTSSGAAALGIVLMFGVIDYLNDPRPMPDPASIFMPLPPAPQLSPTRRISEQDCSKPVDLSGGNLRCK